MNKLAEMLKNHARMLETLKLSPGEAPPSVRSGVTSAVNRAKEDLMRFPVEFSKELRTSCLGLVLHGAEKQQQSFIKYAKQLEKCLFLDAQELWVKAAEQVKPFFGPHKAWFPELTHRVLRCVNEMTANAEGPELMWPPTAPFYVTSDPALVNFIQDNSRKVNGDEVNFYYMNWRLTQLGIEEQVVSDHPVVLLVNSANEMPNKFLPFLGKTFAVNLKETDVVDEEFVLEQLMNVKGE